MKKCKPLCVLFLLLLTLNCSSDDDGNSDGDQQLTVIELLTSGTWYNESKTPGSYDDCEKKGYVQFSDNGTFTIESFEINAGNCESLGIDIATYVLTNDINIVISFEGDILNAEIISITENSLTINTGNETIVFDKTQG